MEAYVELCYLPWVEEYKIDQKGLWVCLWLPLGWILETSWAMFWQSMSNASIVGPCTGPHIFTNENKHAYITFEMVYQMCAEKWDKMINIARYWNLEMVAGEAISTSFASKIKLVLGGSAIISPDIKQSFLFSSKTMLKDWWYKKPYS